MKRAALAIGVIAMLSLLWIAGEAHRENCIREGRAGCSVLPWVAGEKPSTPSGLDPGYFDQLLNP